MTGRTNASTGSGGGGYPPPVFAYTGESELITDSNGWRLRLLTSGSLTFFELNSAENIDIFLVGGGGGAGAYNTRDGAGGGGGGYTKTVRAVAPVANVTYEVQIGSGGAVGQNGNASHISGDGISADVIGGFCGSSGSGGSGGSGGGALFEDGGSDGSSGADYTVGATGVVVVGGAGQGATTREFGEASGDLYAGGGGGSGTSNGGLGGGGGAEENGASNTGGGAGGSNTNATVGGAGIIVIRNHREVSA